MCLFCQIKPGTNVQRFRASQAILDIEFDHREPYRGIGGQGSFPTSTRRVPAPGGDWTAGRADPASDELYLPDGQINQRPVGLEDLRRKSAGLLSVRVFEAIRTDDARACAEHRYDRLILG